MPSSTTSVSGWRARDGRAARRRRWDYGTELTYLQELCAYWEHEFDWRAAEARLNEWPQFETEIDGEHLHFIHARSPHRRAPVGRHARMARSVVEFLDILGPLTDPPAHGGGAAGTFPVVCPRCPDTGGPGPRTNRVGTSGASPRRAALMAELGYERYGAGRRLGSDRDDADRDRRSRAASAST
jgi:hypothetical protein